ncbi:endonuclease/exonuclease/phosphatase family metal-dependent hydrolase [Allocatelliglobosispora scoriae]|uniref:Endonuclease/exonuclease/phosphatase family metal-dependent hydrolase n=2 Tax=Allocatelliglobosispora scoriae TaxID=643052 RepID=A0A841BQD5_9ACTN|nr:endonuclease/exonuclease/phosphatase family metal-dependent hydrolase [Allocatelliglobosispora scoriae]
MAFTPYVALGALVLVPVVAWTRRWGATAVAAVTAVALVACVLPRAFTDSDPQAGATGLDLRVATSNVYAGRADPAEIIRLARVHRVDLLAVQEMTDDWLARADAAGIGDVFAYRYVAIDAGQDGSALFSRYELRDGATRRVGDSWFRQAHADLVLPGGVTVAVESVHAASPYSAEMVGYWRASYRDEPPATPDGRLRVLLGDFNATLDHAPVRRLVDTGYRDAAEVTGDGFVGTWGPYDGDLLPPVTIDHVLADRRIGVRDCHVFGLPGGDHRMLLAELVLP